MSRLVYYIQTGLLNYSKSLELQHKITNQKHKLNSTHFKNILILTEHNPVYTIGIRTKNYSLDDEAKLKNLGAEFYKTNRGGLITFHGPGQLVAYPIIHLKQFVPSMRWYVCHIEKTIIDLCKTSYGITANTTKDTGVWVEDRKLCAIGVHGGAYVTSHGLALNCNTDLNWYNHIVPCGIEGKSVTSLSQELNRDITINSTVPNFLNSFSRIFNCKLKEIVYNDIDRLIN